MSGTVALIPIPFIFRIEKWEESGERERRRVSVVLSLAKNISKEGERREREEEGGQDDEKNGGNRVMHKVVVGGIVVCRGGYSCRYK